MKIANIKHAMNILGAVIKFSEHEQGLPYERDNKAWMKATAELAKGTMQEVQENTYDGDGYSNTFYKTRNRAILLAQMLADTIGPHIDNPTYWLPKE